ncbi:MAG: UDP-2,3-diacylglucosamine diphosphatase [Granulosicoccus sp.]
MNKHCLFIADLHLDPKSQRTIDLALRFLQQARGASELYILGDLFEYWLGDDIGLSLYKPFINELRDLTASGCVTTVMHGNRDFLLGDQFAEQTGTTLVKDDELLIHLNALPVLLMHGDTLCTDDTDYQAFRAQVRDSQWQQTFLNLSASERDQMATKFREASGEASAAKSATIMDVNQDQVSQRLAHYQCTTLIHGHTHRPAHHATDSLDRWVVGDWHPDHARYLRFDGQQLSLHDFQ